MVLGAQAPGRVGRRRITSEGPRERPSLRCVSRLDRDGAHRRSRSLLRAARARPTLAATCRAIGAPARTRRSRAGCRVIPQPYTEERRARLRHAGRDDTLGATAARRRSRSSTRASGELLGGDRHRAATSVEDRRHRLLGGRAGARPRRWRRARCTAARAAGRWSESSSAVSSSSTDPDNVASERVAEKVGFRERACCASYMLHATAATRRRGRCYRASSRSAASRSSSGGCVTNSAARPSSANGLTV